MTAKTVYRLRTRPPHHPDGERSSVPGSSGDGSGHPTPAEHGRRIVARPIGVLLKPHPFRAAVEAHDLDRALALLHDAVIFRSPAVHVPYAGRAAVGHLLRHAGEVLQDLVYVDELHGEGSVALVFRARVGDRNVEGVDHLTLDEDGRITQLRVMIRPLSGLIAMAQTMGARLEADPVPVT